MDDNAERLGRQKMRSDAMKRQFAIHGGVALSVHHFIGCSRYFRLQAHTEGFVDVSILLWGRRLASEGLGDLNGHPDVSLVHA